jgi:serine protease Do
VKTKINPATLEDTLGRIATLLLFFPTLACAQIASFSLQEQVRSSIVKVNALEQGGGVSFGSAVVVAPRKAITACHVLRKAREITLIVEGQTLRARLAAQDVEHDLCLVAAPDLAAPAVDLGASRELVADQTVFAAGYPGGKQFTFDEGEVKALHDHDGARVIQTSARFDPGASGGGLFDAHGRLLGILTFKAASGGDFHFVLPVEWALKLIDGNTTVELTAPSGRAFWERGWSEQPYFLRAAALEQNKNWTGLLQLARKWSDEESHRREPWLAMSKACERLGRRHEALSASHRAAQMDGARISQIEAAQALQEE